MKTMFYRLGGVVLVAMLAAVGDVHADAEEIESGLAPSAEQEVLDEDDRYITGVSPNMDPQIIPWKGIVAHVETRNGGQGAVYQLRNHQQYDVFIKQAWLRFFCSNGEYRSSAINDYVVEAGTSTAWYGVGCPYDQFLSADAYFIIE